MKKVALYFERLSFSVVFITIFKHIFVKKLFQKIDVDIYFFDSTYFIRKLFIPYIKLFKVNIECIKFRMMDVRDERGELIRLRISRKDLFEIRNNIINSDIYNSLINESNYKDRVVDYLRKAVAVDNIDDAGTASRVLYIILVVDRHMRKYKYDASLFVIDSRAWFSIYEEYALRYCIHLHQVNYLNVFSAKKNIYNLMKNYPALYGFFKNIKHKKIRNDCPLDNEIDNFLYVEGRGDIDLSCTGRHSDFFWCLNSNFPRKNILYKYLTLMEKNYLDKHGVLSVPEGAYLDNTYNENTRTTKIKYNHLYKNEFKELNSLVKSYDLERFLWASFFRLHKVKVYFTWYKYSKEHLAIADAINDNNGISVVWQMAFDGFETAGCYMNFDLSFYFSQYSYEINKKSHSKIKYSIITGYPKDYAANLLKSDALELREKLKRNGAEKIIFVIDENSNGDNRWHTGHYLQQENYSFVLNKMLETPWLGVIFKPKVANTLRERLGDVALLLSEAEATGRCYVYEDSGRKTTSAPPILAGLSADVCIHGHLSSGTAALECALEGIPTLLIDREGCPDSKLYELEEGKVIFKNWPETIDAVMEHFNAVHGTPGFGDWSSIIDDLDPFRDGMAANRIGTYLNWLIQGYEQGLKKDTILENAAEKYKKIWGDDKIVINL